MSNWYRPLIPMFGLGIGFGLSFGVIELIFGRIKSTDNMTYVDPKDISKSQNLSPYIAYHSHNPHLCTTQYAAYSSCLSHYLPIYTKDTM